MEEYTTYRLGDIAECTLGKMLDQKKNKGNPQVYLGNVAVRWGSFNVDFSQTMLFEDKELDKYQAIKGDIVLCEGGEPGRCAIWEEDWPICIQKALHRIRVNEDIASPYYVYYYLTNLVKSGKAEPYFTGSTIKHLPREKLISLELSLPCLNEQERRAAIIRSLDDKITLNNRISHNLEEQADCLVLSAIETQSIGSAHLWDICSYVTERANCDTLNNENYISTDNMLANRGGVGVASTIPDGKCTSFKSQDVLVSNIRPYFKKIWRASFSGGCSNDVLCFRTTTGASSFLYHLLRSDIFFEYVMSGAKGSKMPRGDKHHILSWVIPVFEKEFIASLEGSLEVFDDRVAIIQEENRRLSAIRDSLLPMLITNNIGINDLTC